MTISMLCVLLRQLYRGISTCQRAWLFWTAALWHSAPCHRCRRTHPATAAEPQCRRAPPAPPPVHPPPAAASVRFSEPPAAQPLKPTPCPRAAASHPQGRCGKSKLSVQKLAPSVRTITTRTPLAAISPRPEATALPRELQEKPAGGRSSHQPPARRRARRPLRYFSAFCTLSPCSQLPHGAASPQPCPPPPKTRSTPPAPPTTTAIATGWRMAPTAATPPSHPTGWTKRKDRFRSGHGEAERARHFRRHARSNGVPNLKVDSTEPGRFAQPNFDQL